MTDMNKRDLLSEVTDETTRRSVLQSIGIGITGIGVGTSNVAAKPDNRSIDDYDMRMDPAQRNIGYNISITNNLQDEVNLTIRYQRETPGKKNPVIFTQEFDIPNRRMSDEEFPNVIRDKTPIQLGTPGWFVIEVESSTGHAESIEFFNGTGRIQQNEAISVNIDMNSVEVNILTA